MYDVAIIGAGPAGYKCALICSELGLSTVIIDNNAILGGTCLRVGCIPSKAMLHASHKYYELTSRHLESVGIKVDSVEFDLKACIDASNKNIKSLSDGISFLFKKNNVTLISGYAEIQSTSPGGFSIQVSLAGSNEKVSVKTKKIVIATGSVHAAVNGINIDERVILSSTGCLRLASIPKSMVVLGAGAIGLEMASIWSRLGSNVTVVELGGQISPTSDQDISKTLQALLERQGIRFLLNSKITSAKTSENSVVATITNGQNAESIESEKLLVAVGRSPNTSGLHKSIELDQRGFIRINDSYQTSLPEVFAIGDVTGGPMLAHKAEFEAMVVAEMLSGKKVHQEIDLALVPQVIYTSPPAASIGRTERYLTENGIDYKVGKSKFAANGRAKVSFCTDGFVKILSHRKYDTILGVHIVGESADIMINEASVALAYGASSEDIFRICHSHPDLSETFRDAAFEAFMQK